MSDNFDYNQDFEGFWSQLVTGDAFEGNWEGDESAGFGIAVSFISTPPHGTWGKKSAGKNALTSFPTPNSTPHGTWGIGTAQGLSNVFSGDQRLGLNAVVPPPSYAATNFARNLSVSDVAWSEAHKANGLTFGATTAQSIGSGSSMTLGSETGPPEYGIRPVFGVSLSSTIPNLPATYSSDGAGSQVLAPSEVVPTSVRNITSCANTNFVFESREVPIEPNQVPSRQRKCRDSGLRCEFPGCHSRATFKRKYELQRHMKKHERKETYPCPAIDCDRKGSRSFYRSDKLNHHLRTAHRADDEYLCPLAECLTDPMSFDGLKLHARNHSASHAVVESLGRIPTSERQCMLKNCQKWLDIAELQSHLLNHTMNDRLEESSAIQQMGYDAETGKIICPLCKVLIWKHKEFTTHLESVHFAPDLAHLTKFRNSVRDFIYLASTQGKESWTPWEVSSYRMSFFVRYTSCPTCGQPASTQEDCLFIDHHLQLLSDQNEVRPYRWDILRLCPGFGTHPVFNDIKPSVHSRSYIVE